MQAVLELLGTVEEEALFRLCDLVIDRDTAGALTYLEELAERGHDLGRLVLDLIEHLRQIMLAQHLGDVPEVAATSEEARERLKAQANQLEEATVLRLVDLLAIAVDDMRQGGDPRLPLELALVKVTRPASDLSRESIAFRLERLEQGHGRRRPPATAPRQSEAPSRSRPPSLSRCPVPSPSARRRASSSRSCRRRGRARSCRPSRSAADPDCVAAARGASRGAERRHAHARVPAERAVPPRQRPRPEEREPAAPTRSTTSRAAGSSSSSSSARRARRPAAERGARRRGTRSWSCSRETFDARERES